MAKSCLHVFSPSRTCILCERGETEILREELDVERARSAELRVRLQRAHGALFAFRMPEDVNQPLSAWRWNPDAMRDLQALYDLPKLLESTRPDTATGADYLDRRRALVELLRECALRLRVARDILVDEAPRTQEEVDEDDAFLVSLHAAITATERP